MKYFRYLIFILYFSLLQGAVQESVVPFANNFDQIDPKKYTPTQLELFTHATNNKEKKLRIGTFNILFDLYDHNLDVPYKWPSRCPRVIEMIHHIQPDILGVQELYPRQLPDLLKELENYRFFAEPNPDGEHCGILYNPERLTLLEHRCYPLTAFNQLLLVKVKDNITQNVFAFCNVHLSFSNVEAREKEARAIHAALSEFLAEEDNTCPLILVGDMNTFPNRPTLKRLPFYDGDYVENVMKNNLLEDAKDVSLFGHVGPTSTFTNCGEDPKPFLGTGTPGVFLDHIYVTPDITVLIHAIEPGKVDGHYPSDHMPLFADILLQDIK